MTCLADSIQFDSLNSSDVDTIVKELGSSFSHTTLSTAGSLGTLFGIEAGIVGGVLKSDGIESLVNSASGGSQKVGAIPFGALVAGVSLPLGLGAEASFIPNQSAFGDFEFNKVGLAAKWTLTDAFIPLPFDLSVRAHHTVAKFSFDQTINNSSTGNTDVAATVDYNANVSGLQILVGRSLLLVSPYLGFGYVRVDGHLEVIASGAATIFDPSLTASQKVESTESGIEYFAGVQLNLLLIRAAIEVGKILDNEKVALKLSLKF